MKAPEAVPIKWQDARVQSHRPAARLHESAAYHPLERAEQIPRAGRPPKRQHVTLTLAHGYCAAARETKKAAVIL
jgi:hypothetical protein